MQHKGVGLRINAQLIDVHSTQNIWAGGYDGNDAASLQDEAVRRINLGIAGADGKIRQNEEARVKDKTDAQLTEYDYYLKGQELYWRSDTIERHDRAGAIWLQGLKKFPDSSLLRVKLGWYYFERAYAFSADRPADERRAGEYARAALAAPNPPLMVQWLGHYLMAYIHWHEADFVRAVQDAEAAVAINPADADSISSFARVQIAAGNPERAIEWIQASIRLNPDIPRNTRLLAWAYYLMGDYEKSLAAAKQHLKLTREFPDEAYLYTAAAAMRLGRPEEAHAALQTHIQKCRPSRRSHSSAAGRWTGLTRIGRSSTAGWPTLRQPAIPNCRSATALRITDA